MTDEPIFWQTVRDHYAADLTTRVRNGLRLIEGEPE